MKKTFNNNSVLILLVVLAFSTSCISSQSFMPVKGSGMSVDKNFNVSDFQGIDVSGGFDVVLMQGESEELVLTAQNNLFEHITVKVDQGVLRIYTKDNIMATKPMKARISFKSIDNLKVSGGGDISCETPLNVPTLDVNLSGGGDLSSVINTGELKCRISGGGDARIDGSIKNYYLDISGGGDVKSAVDAGIVSCKISGGGDLTLKDNEKASDATIAVNGGGDIEVEMNVEKLTCSVSGGGNASLTGQASELKISVNGGGDINAGRFLTGTASFQASGGSDIHVNVSKELTGQISGGGDVYYSGSPEKVSVDTRGGSEIHKQ